MVYQRLCRGVFATVFCLATVGGVLDAAPSALISEPAAERHGLTRPWFTQVELDQARAQLNDVVLHEGTLFAQTDRAMVQAIDAETGRTLWAKQVGLRGHPSLPPGANRHVVAIINGSRLYLLDRFNGDLLWEKELDGSPGAGPDLSAQRVYVPLANGLMIAYRLDAPPKDAETEKEEASLAAINAASGKQPPLPVSLTTPPLFCQSYGHTFVQPLVIRENLKEEYVIWPTDRGYLNVARIDRTSQNGLLLKYRLETGAAIVGRPSYLPPDPKEVGDSGLIVTASRDGFVYVFREKDGRSLWRFSIGEPIVTSPAVIEDYVFVSSELGGMYCLSSATGKEIWFAPDLAQFVAVGKARVYAADTLGRLVVLDARSGMRLDVLPAENTPIKVLNTSTDRIYLATRGGLIQCLHEIAQTTPTQHGLERKLAAEAKDRPVVKQEGIKDVEKPLRKERAGLKKPVAPKERTAKPKNTEEDGNEAVPNDPFAQ
jgi:outer membrane protein assembly factor BamB